MTTISFKVSSDEAREIRARARRERYAALARCAAERGIPCVLVGHHADDQLETMLLAIVLAVIYGLYWVLKQVKASRETAFTDLEFYSDEESDRFIPDGMFKDGWIHELGPQEWSSPGASLDSEVFWQTYRDCSNKLPKNIATVFNLREVDGIESKEICALLNISENNLWVMLHRARMALRRCLETNWFAKQEGAR